MPAGAAARLIGAKNQMPTRATGSAIKIRRELFRLTFDIGFGGRSVPENRRVHVKKADPGGAALGRLDRVSAQVPVREADEALFFHQVL